MRTAGSPVEDDPIGMSAFQPRFSHEAAEQLPPRKRTSWTGRLHR